MQVRHRARAVPWIARCMAPPTGMDGLALPAFLGRFDLERLAKDASTIVAIDERYATQWLNPGWEIFARENHGEAIPMRFGLGTCYLDGISGPLRGFYQAAFENALLTGEPFELDYECSSPQVFRRSHMLVLPVSGEGLLLVHSLVVERPHDRAEQPSLEEAYRLANGMILQCANCRRVRRKDGSSWDWVPAWIAATPPRTSHGICACCRGFYWGGWKQR